jgi:hypothetical protein
LFLRERGRVGDGGRRGLSFEGRHGGGCRDSNGGLSRYREMMTDDIQTIKEKEKRRRRILTSVADSKKVGGEVFWGVIWVC